MCILYWRDYFTPEGGHALMRNTILCTVLCTAAIIARAIGRSQNPAYLTFIDELRLTSDKNHPRAKVYYLFKIHSRISWILLEASSVLKESWRIRKNFYMVDIFQSWLSSSLGNTVQVRLWFFSLACRISMERRCIRRKEIQTIYQTSISMSISIGLLSILLGSTDWLFSCSLFWNSNPLPRNSN